jgi:hypothetical protein
MKGAGRAKANPQCPDNGLQHGVKPWRRRLAERRTRETAGSDSRANRQGGKAASTRRRGCAEGKSLEE